MRFGLFLLIAFVVSIPRPGGAFTVGISPSDLNPGDPFVLRICEAGSSPSASLEDRAMSFAEDPAGCHVAIGAVEVSTAAGEYGISVKADDVETTVFLVVEAKEFPVERLTLPEDKVTLSPEDSRRADEEAERLKALWAISSDKLMDGGFARPLGNAISCVFGTRRYMNGKKKNSHSGIDIRGRTGEEVSASNRGRVVLAEELFFGGNTVVLDHGMGVFTVYMHLSEISVALNQTVGKGDTVGLVGSTGRSTGSHLHFGVKVGGISVDPEGMLRLPL